MRHSPSRLLLLPVAALAVLAFSIGSAAAHERQHGHDKHSHEDRWEHQHRPPVVVFRPGEVRHHHPVRAMVPVRLQAERMHLYTPYYVGSYRGPGNRMHEVYHFPVWVGERVVYQPYVYCGGILVPHPVIPEEPRFHVRAEFRNGQTSVALGAQIPSNVMVFMTPEDGAFGFSLDVR